MSSPAAHAPLVFWTLGALTSGTLLAAQLLTPADASLAWAECAHGNHHSQSAAPASLMPATDAGSTAAESAEQAGENAQEAALSGLEMRSFALNLVLYAAASQASPSTHAALHPLLLGYEPSAQVDRHLPWRRQLACEVGRWPAAARGRMLAYLLAHPVAVTHINALVLQMVGPAPTFTAVPGEVDTRALDAHLVRLWQDRGGLADLMQEAWGPLGGAFLWQKYGPHIRAARVLPSQVAALRGQVAGFLGLPLTPLAAGSQVLRSPLMPADAAVTSVFPDGRIWLVVGPTASPRQDSALIAHELAHPLLQAAIDASPRLRHALAESRCTYAAVQARGESPLLIRMVYTTWETYFTEALIRGSIDDLFPAATAHELPLVLEPTLARALAQAHRRGRTGSHAIEDLLGHPCLSLCADAAPGA